MRVLAKSFVSAICLVLVSFAFADQKLNEDLVNAAKKGELDKVKTLLTQGADINGGTKDGTTALMEAARTGKAEVVQALIKAGAALDAQNKDGYTAMMRAIFAAQVETLQMLVSAGANVQAKNNKGKTAFQLAVTELGTANVHPELVTILVKAGVDVNKEMRKEEPVLIYAINSLQDNTVKGLLQAGADPNVNDKKGRPAVVLAAQNGRLKEGVNMVALLLAFGADANAKDTKNRTALEYAVDIYKGDYQDEQSKSNYGMVAYILANKGANADSIAAARKIIWEKGYFFFDTMIDEGKKKAAQATSTPQQKQPATSGSSASVPKPAGKCPANIIQYLMCDSPEFKASLPVDFSKIKSAKALSKEGGKRVRVFLANAAFSAKQMDNSMIIPVKNKGEAYIILNFMNGSNKVTAGAYKPSAGWGKPFSISAEVAVTGAKPAGVIITMVSAIGSDQGSATITDITDKYVCGKFELKGALGNLTGEFAADLEIE